MSKIRRFLPAWSEGRQAGIIRNIEMGKYADRLLAVWDGESHGTKQMIDWMRLYGKPVTVITMPYPTTGMPAELGARGHRAGGREVEPATARRLSDFA